MKSLWETFPEPIPVASIFSTVLFIRFWKTIRPSKFSACGHITSQWENPLSLVGRVLLPRYFGFGRFEKSERFSGNRVKSPNRCRKTENAHIQGEVGSLLFGGDK